MTQDDLMDERQLGMNPSHGKPYAQNGLAAEALAAQFKANKLTAEALGGPQAARWSWRCFFGIHRWTKWSAERPMFQRPNRSTEVGQDKSCVNCNKIESRLTL